MNYAPNILLRPRPFHEGVGNALRAAFLCSSSDYGLPDDMKSLLGRLD